MVSTFSLSLSSPFSLNPNPFLNPNSNPPPKPLSLSSFKIRCNGTNNTPIAPWMRTPFVETSEKTKTPPKKPDNSLTEKVSGARGKRAMKEILRGIGEMDKTQNNPGENLAKDESFSSFKERMPWEGKARREKEPTGAEFKEIDIGKMGKIEDNPVGNLAKDERFSSFKERIPWEGKERGSVIQKARREKGSTLAELKGNLIGKMGKIQDNPIGNLAKDESFSSFKERMPWDGEERGLMIRKTRREREPTTTEIKEILIDKMDKIQDNPIGNLAKDESFSSFKEKMPWEGEDRGLVIGRVKREKEPTCAELKENLIDKMDKTQNNPIGNLAKDESFSSFKERMPWEREERGVVIERVRREKEPTAAKLKVDGEVLKRLKGESAKMRVWVKVNKAGVTQDVVDQVWITWRSDELAMMKFEVPLKWNMGRAREIVESKTGGLVVWTKNDTLVVYRGCNYKLGLETSPETRSKFSNGNTTREEMIERNNSEKEEKAIKDSLYVREADRLLEGLGPRFIDWWSEKPLPVDGDLLPQVVPGFKTPFRLCPPPHARAKLTDYELTYLRKLARPLPTHFVLGRNRRLQGLAAAILKLWEKCHIVKIALKWGAMNTSNEEMANELKDLTGGVLLLRNKFIIIIYRGKDFLPCGVADQVVEREMELRDFQLEEETARSKAIDLLNTTCESVLNSSSTGTLSEYRELQSDRARLYNGYNEANVQLEAEKEKLEKQLRNQERKLIILQMKIKRSLRELAKVNSSWRFAESDSDQEMISEEERESFRKIGLKLDSSLLLGRRGVFKGVIEGVYQHWKHREIAKVITMQKLLSRVVYTAKQLESETGGILVSVDKLKEGHAIILYRGKNHKRPQKFVSPNLLTKREALSRSLEMQRNGSLRFFAYQRQKAIFELKCKLADLEKRRESDRRKPERWWSSRYVNSMDLVENCP